MEKNGRISAPQGSLMNLRDLVMEHQLNLKSTDWNGHRCTWARAWAESEGQTLAMRWAAVGTAKLADLNFLHLPEEPLIGRIKPEQHSEIEIRKAEEYLQQQNMWAGGQTGHAEPFYEDLFALGFDRLRRKVSPMPSFVVALDGIVAMIEKAAEQANNENISAMCRRIAHEPPVTFQEAIQLIWFVMLAIQSGDHAALVGPGRLDRRLGAFYEADVAAGLLTRESALHLIETLYLFINFYCPRGLAYAVMAGGGETFNEVSMLSLEALRRTRLVYPSVGVCWNPVMPEELKMLAIELISEGISNVAIFNDELIQKSMRAYGVPESEASEYINSTCVEITPCGSSNVYVASPYFSLCAILLDCLKVSTAQTWMAFQKEFFDCLGGEIDRAAVQQNRLRLDRKAKMRRPIQSLFTRDCLGRQLDIEEGGALYNWVECSFVGLANLVDSLTVIRREVFENQFLTLSELSILLEQNFEGSEAMRLRFLNASPKYGNADSEVDQELGLITGFLAERCARQRMEPDQSPFIPGTFCWEKHQRLGKICGATPDGRRAGLPFADGAGPAQGREKQGPTAAIHSVCSWDHQPMLGGSAFNQRYTAAAVRGKDARRKLQQLIEVFIRQGGFETQINILDAETLKKAQLNPEEYRDLIVRIGGYTDYFTGLSPEMQAEIITRTQYEGV